MGYREFAATAREEIGRFKLSPDRIADLGFPVLRWALAERELLRVGRSSFLDLPLVSRSGLWAEFGVFKCESLALLAGARGLPSSPECVTIAARVVGFDSFRGLPEDWFNDPNKGEHGESHPRGEFALPGVPDPPEGAELVVGSSRKPSRGSTRGGRP